MWTREEQTENESAYHKLREDLKQQYPHMHFVAFGHGLVIANSADFKDLLEKIREYGRDPRDVMVIRVGDTRLKKGYIFARIRGIKR